jgi:hypothetical protein
VNTPHTARIEQSLAERERPVESMTDAELKAELKLLEAAKRAKRGKR